MHSQELIGNDVICIPGQNLTGEERRVLLGLADGETPSEIEQSIHADKGRVRQLIGSIRAKLGAQSKTHIISRAFILGVIIPRSLCVLLSISTLISPADELMRNRSPRNPRTSQSIAQSARTNTRGGSGRKA